MHVFIHAEGHTQFPRAIKAMHSTELKTSAIVGTAGFLLKEGYRFFLDSPGPVPVKNKNGKEG